MVEKRKNFIVNFVYFAIVAGVAVVVFKFSANYLMPFIIGFVIAFLLKPVIQRMTQKFGEKRVVSFIVILVFYIAVAFLLFWIFVAVIAGIQNFGKGLPAFYQNTLSPVIDSLIQWLDKSTQNLDPNFVEIIDSIGRSLVSSIENIVKALSGGAVNFITRVLSSIPSLLISILIAIISSFFFTLDYRNIVDNLLAYIPQRQQELLMDVKEGFITVVGKYLRAYAKLMSLTFVELSIGFFILGIGNPIGLAFMVAIIDILPVLGTGTVMIPWIIIEFVTGNSQLGFGLLALYLIITVIRNVLEPKVVGDQIGLHPLATLILIYVGLKLFGFLGLFGLPISATILKTLHDQGKISVFNDMKKSGITPLEEEHTA